VVIAILYKKSEVDVKKAKKILTQWEAKSKFCVAVLEKYLIRWYELNNCVTLLPLRTNAYANQDEGMSKSIIRIGAVCGALFSGLLQAMTFDNRFFPLIQYPFITVECRPSHVRGDFFVTTANEAFGPNDIDQIGIPELFGRYDEQLIAQSLVAIGKPNPLPAPFQNVDLPWNLAGKIQSQGFVFIYRQEIIDPVSVGLNWFFMHVNSRQEFFLNKTGFTLDEQQELDDLRRQMERELGLSGPNANQFGMGDFEAYIRVGSWLDYMYKFRRIEAGIRLGALLPAGVVRDINNPASVPFGGNGHYGIFGAIDAEFELKEDWKAGFLLRASKRFARTCVQRMPVNNTPYLFGAVVGPARVNPGATVIFAPYASFENLREGLGARIQYTLIWHGCDDWCDKRINPTVPVVLDQVIKHSSWASDYITLTVFYDFGKVKMHRCFEPAVLFSWDIPASLLVARNCAKTNRISLGLEFNF
jgi:hypothetical protein